MKTSKKLRGAVALGLTTSLALGVSCSSPEAECEKSRVYAQNRWEPLGTAIRQEPDVLSEKIGGFAPNEVIAVNGWYDSGEPTYPTNSEPWNSSEWFRLANQDGWVSFAGVRGETTSPDPTGHADGGKPAVLQPICEIEDIPN